jgi:tellurium resistance protein TerD
MAVTLQKGQNVSLSKEAPGLKEVTFGLGWDARSTDGTAFDLDASALILGESNKVLSDNHFIFYNNTADPSGAVTHTGDNRTGEGEGDDERIIVDISKMPAEAKKVVFVATIHEAETRKQNFGQVSNAFIRAINNADNKEIARYDLSEDASIETAMIFGEFYRHGEEWKFKAVGQGYAGGLAGVARDFGVNIG